MKLRSERKGKKDLEGVVEEIGQRRNGESDVVIVRLVKKTQSFVNELNLKGTWCTFNKMEDRTGIFGRLTLCDNRINVAAGQLLFANQRNEYHTLSR